MELLNKEKTTALQNSIETGTLEKLGFINVNEYKQHNINLEDGFKGIMDIHDLLPMDKVTVNVVRAFQDGDYAFVHVDYFLFEPTVAFDIHRYKDGQAVEHWDNLQFNSKIPNKSGRTMTDGKTKSIDHHKTAENKNTAKRFVEEILINEDFENASNFFNGDELIQHNPNIGDGVAQYFNALKVLKQQNKPMKFNKVHKVLGEGNFVLVLSDGFNDNEEVAFYNLFRIENDKIIEHWDVIEKIPARDKQLNSNGKF